MRKLWFLFKFFFWGWDFTIFTCWTRNQKLYVTFRYYKYIFSFSLVLELSIFTFKDWKSLSVKTSPLSLPLNQFSLKILFKKTFPVPWKDTLLHFFSVDFVILPLALGSSIHLVSRNNSVLFFSIEWASFSQWNLWNSPFFPIWFMVYWVSIYITTFSQVSIKLPGLFVCSLLPFCALPKSISG